MRCAVWGATAAILLMGWTLPAQAQMGYRLSGSGAGSSLGSGLGLGLGSGAGLGIVPGISTGRVYVGQPYYGYGFGSRWLGPNAYTAPSTGMLATTSRSAPTAPTSYRVPAYWSTMPATVTAGRTFARGGAPGIASARRNPTNYIIVPLGWYMTNYGYPPPYWGPAPVVPPRILIRAR
jgi:hypothetical protein